MAKYDALQAHLAAQSQRTDRLTMSFAEVEALVGSLPTSAWNHRAWWANDSKVQARAWRAAGWHVESVDQKLGKVVFARGVVGGSRVAQQSVRPGADRPAVMPEARPPAAPQPTAEEGIPEATAQAMLVAYLVGQGWQIQRTADTATRERGIDVLATRGSRTLAVEVKGYPGRRYADPRRAGERKPTAPSVQARHWYAQAILQAMLMCDEYPGYDIAIAVPDVSTYRSLHQRTSRSLRQIGIMVFFIAANGNVREG